MPLDSKVDGLSSWDANVVAGAKGKADGKLYAVPLATQTLQMFYNKDIFARAGPRRRRRRGTQFVEVNARLKEPGITPMAVGAKDAWMLPISTDIFGRAAVRRRRLREGRADRPEDLHRPRLGRPRSTS